MRIRQSPARVSFLFFLLICLLGGLIGVVRLPVDAAPDLVYPATSVVISEFRTQGPNGGNDEFIELYNPTSSSVNIGGWTINGSNNAGSTSIRATIPDATSLMPGQYFLIANTSANGYSGTVPPDLQYSTGITNDGGIALLNGTIIIDQVGMSGGSAYGEGTRLGTFNNPAGSYERRIGGNNGSCQDDDNNAADFTLVTPSNPQNLSSPIVSCGVPTVTPSPTPPNVVINEVAWAGTLASSDDEWIELYNAGGTDIDIGGWRLVAEDGAPDIIFPNGTTITAGSYFLLERAREQVTDVPSDFIYFGALDNTGEILRLRRPDGTIVDTANANGGPWPAGSSSPNASMERYNTGVENDFIWGSNNGTVVWNGLDAFGNPIHGTPKNLNWASNVTPTPTNTFTPTVTNTATATPTGTPTNTSTPPPSATPAGFLSVVINEIAWMGTLASTADEWIELYNPGSTAINITGWTLRGVDGTPNITLNGTIPAGGYFILERSDDNTISDVTANQIFTGDLGNTNEILQLIDTANRTIDTANANGGPWPAGSTSTYGSMERRGVVPDSDTAWITNANPASWTKHDARGTSSTSFLIRGTPGYANWAITVTATPSPRPTTTRTPVRTSTPAPPPPPPLVAINEFVPRPGSDWNGDGVINTGDEYIELLNHGVVPVNLGGYRLDDEVNIGSSPFALPAITIQPGERVVFYGSETGLLLSDGGDGVRLLRPNGTLMDAYNYTVVNRPDQAFCRLPDNGGADDWNTNCFPTPGLPNSLSGTVLRPPTEIDADHPLCPIADTLPLEFFLAECTPFGDNIWNRYYWDRFGWFGEKSLLFLDGKWDVYAD